MAFAVGTLFHSWLLAMLADLGDKTWMMSVCFAAWCPVCGIRDNGPGMSVAEYSLLYLGVSGALIVRTVLIACGVDPFAWDGFCEVAATVMLAIIGVRVTYEWRCSLYEGGDELAVRPPCSAQEVLPIQDVGDDGKPSGPKWTKVLPTAMLLPAIVILFVEAGDRSQGALLSTGHKRGDLAVGASLGFCSSTLLAVLSGFIIKRHVTVKWLLFLIFSLTWLVAVSCFRDALVRLLLGSMPGGGSH